MVKKNGAACPCQPEDILRPPVPPITPIVSVKSVNGKVGDITCTESILAADLTSTISVGGVSAGESFAQGTSLEAIVRKILCPTKTLQSIAITTPPTKVSYTVGEVFDKDGMVVTAYYEDGTSQAVTTYTFSPSTALTLTDTKVTISYTEDGIVKTAEQAITVVSVAVAVYFGALSALPTSEEALSSLTETSQTVTAMQTGVARNIAADEQYVTIAYKDAIGTITSITEDGFEAISDFSNQFTFGEYKFYCTADKVYDPDAEINFVIKWSIN